MRQRLPAAPFLPSIVSSEIERSGFPAVVLVWNGSHRLVA
jgi:hypothetical protein